MEVRKLFSLPFLSRPLRVFSHPQPTIFRRALTTTSISTATPASSSTTSGLGSLGSKLSEDPRIKSYDANSPLRKHIAPESLPEYHLHIYATRHNTHLTFSGPHKGGPRNSIISISSGNLGFRKGARGTFDAGYQLGVYLMNRIQQQGLLPSVQRVEVVFRGFGQGRDALSKILLGVEGQILRNRIIRVVDATRLKIGGTRSPKPRRL